MKTILKKVFVAVLAFTFAVAVPVIADEVTFFIPEQGKFELPKLDNPLITVIGSGVGLPAGVGIAAIERAQKSTVGTLSNVAIKAGPDVPPVKVVVVEKPKLDFTFVGKKKGSPKPQPLSFDTGPAEKKDAIEFKKPDGEKPKMKMDFVDKKPLPPEKPKLDFVFVGKKDGGKLPTLNTKK